MSSRNLSCIKTRLELHNGCGMGVTVSGIRAGEKIQKLTGPTTSLALSRDSFLEAWLRHCVPVGGSQQPHCGSFRIGICLWMIIIKYFKGVNCFVCVSAFYLGNHLNGLMDLHTKCCPIELFCMPCVSPLNQASHILSHWSDCWVT